MRRFLLVLVSAVLGGAAIGAPAALAATVTPDQLYGLPLLDDLQRNDPPPTFSVSGMGAGKWSTPVYVASRGGAYNSGGKLGYGSTAGVASGAYWNAQEFKDTGSGVAVEATLTAPLAVGEPIALMLNQPNPASALSGYELVIESDTRFGKDHASLFLYKWTSGTPELLNESIGGIGLPGATYGLAEKNGEVSAWGTYGSTPWVIAIGVPDASPFKSGYAGLIVIGNGPTLDNFSAGPLRPSMPQVKSTTPASPGASTTPKVSGTAEAGATVKIFTNSSCSGSPAASGSAAGFASPGISVTVAEGSTTTFYANATNSESLSSPCSSTAVTYTQDSKPPAAPTFNWTQPASPSSKTSLKVGGAAESGSTVKLYTNATCTGSPVATGSAATFASPGIATAVSPNTTTTYRATATDAAGNTSACSSTTQKYVNAASEILFEGSALSDFNETYECVPGKRVTEALDPLGSGKTVMSFELHDSDGSKDCKGGGVTPNEDPRAQVVSLPFIKSGDEFWLRTKFLIPAGFQEFFGSSFMALTSVFGPPFNGSSPWRTELLPFETEEVKGDFLAHLRDNTPCESSDIPWIDTESRYGQWVEILLHEKFAKAGFVEEWIDGVQEKFFDPATSYNPCGLSETTKLEFETMDSSNNGGLNSVRIGQYREREAFEPETVYYEFVKVGTTKASVGG